MSSASPRRGARRSTREASSSRRSTSIAASASPAAQPERDQLDLLTPEPPPAAIPEDDEPDPDDSAGSIGRRKNRPEINRRVPHQSFAYGAPSDGKSPRRSIGGRQSSTGGRDSASVEPRASASMTPSPHKPAIVIDAEPAPDASPPPQQSQFLPPPPPPAAKSRYEALRARNQAAKAKASAKEAASVTTTATSASGSVPSTAIEPSDDEVDSQGKSRKISVEPPANIAQNSLAARSRQSNSSQLNSFFVRAPPQSISPAPEDRPTGRPVMPSSLLRGAQKQPQDHIPPLLNSPRRRGVPNAVLNSFGELDSMRSSDAGDSVSRSDDYGAEEAFVLRDGIPAARGTTPSARPVTQGWLQKLSPWRAGVSNGSAAPNQQPAAQTSNDNDANLSSGSAKRRHRAQYDPSYRPSRDFEEDDDDDEEGSTGGHRAKRRPRTLQEEQEEEDDADASTRTARRKPRTSQSDRDQTYRPPKDLADDDDESSSDGGRRPRRKSGRKSAGDHSARGGRDDNRIWMSGKKRKGRKGARGGVQGEDEEEEEEDVSDSASLGQEDQTVDDSLLVEDDPHPTNRRITARAKKAKRDSVQSAGTDSWVKTLGAAALILLTGYLCMPSQTSDTLEDSANASWGWWRGPACLPLVGRIFSSSQRSAFAAPNVAPSDFETFVQRLLSVETTVSSLSSSSSSLLASRDSMAKQLASLEMSSQEVSKLLRQMESRSNAERDGIDGRVKALEEVGERLREQAIRVEEQLNKLQSQGEVSSAEQRKSFDEQLKALQRDLKRNEEEIAKVLTSAVRAEQMASEAQNALRPLLEMNLPAQLPVKIDQRSGRPVIEGWFYEALKGMLGSGEGAPSSTPAAVSAFDWDTFRTVNDASLRALISEQSANVFSAQRQQHAILSRSDFLDLLSRELDTMKGVLETRFNENAQGIQNDILAKVRSQNAMYADSGSLKGSASQGRRQREQDASSTLPLMQDISLAKIQTKDGSDATTAILTLIDAALEAYSADKINRADFAGYSAGGRVIPSMTSPTYEYSVDVSGGKSTLSWMLMPWRSKTSVEKFRGRSPAHALHHDNSAGMCWPFKGSFGQLGIQLARPVIISDITIDHAPLSLLFGDGEGGGISSAPREITVTGYVQRPEDRMKLKEWQQQQRAAQETRPEGEEEETVDIHENPPANHIHLASFTYQAGEETNRATQTFAVSAEARALRIPIMVIQVRVQSNYGNERFTCLYRVRVHGEAVDLSDM